MDVKITKLIVFGATGQTGIAILRTALNQGLEVTAFVRDPKRIPEDIRTKVKVFTGDVLDAEAVAKAIEGNEAVLSSLGTGLNWGATTVLSEGSSNIIKGMKLAGVTRLALVISAYNFGNEHAISYPPFLKAIVEDHGRQLEILKEENDIDWFALMPPRIFDKTTVGEYKVGYDKTPGCPNVTTFQLADFMLKCVVEKDSMKEHRHQFIGISSGPCKNDA